MAALLGLIRVRIRGTALRTFDEQIPNARKESSRDCHVAAHELVLGFSGNGGKGHVAEVRFEAVATQCPEIMNGSNGGLDRTVKTTISIDCYYRSWPTTAE